MVGRPGPWPAGCARRAIAEHVEQCPFCGRDFDRRDLGQVLEHYDHQLAADARPAIDLSPDDDYPRHLRKAIPFERGRKS